MAEYSGSSALLRRYVHWPRVDAPLLWYEGSSLSVRRGLVANHQGSIVAVTDASGASLAINAYDAYGVPNAANLGRFQYTGQIWIAELGLYHYKARLYSATLGRFMQTDPIGYDDDVNLYSYVRSDPVNSIDPSGLDTYTLAGGVDVFVGAGVGLDVGLYFNPGLKPGERLDFGFVVNGRLGVGVDQSVALNVGRLTGPAENLNGASLNIALGAGPLTYTATRANPFAERSQQAQGESVGIGLSVTPITANATGGYGGKFGLQDVISVFKSATDTLSRALERASSIRVSSNSEAGTVTATFEPKIGTRIAPPPVSACVDESKCGKAQ